jgi:hypothetical protein
MSDPKRIQRQRTNGWKMPEGAVYVGRGSHLGNPFRIYQHCKGPDGDWGIEDSGRLCATMGHGWTRAGAARTAVEMYEKVLNEIYPPKSTARYILAHDLRGKDLVCWCKLSDPCHADVLLEIVNGNDDD